MNPINLVWETRREAVEDELKEMLDVKELDQQDPRCFQQRNAAAKRVLGMMSERHRAEFDEELTSRRKSGNPEPVRRE